MKNDEFAFFNHQLAAMLRDGLPLEGALRRLCQDMRHGTLRTELELLKADLTRGVPLTTAVAARKLPELYQRMLVVGVQSNDLPAVLMLLGDYYQRRHGIWTRLKGLMVYPTIVLISAFLISIFLAVILASGIEPNLRFLTDKMPTAISMNLWLTPVILGVALALFSVFIVTPAARRFLRWRLPAFRESSLAQMASAMALMLKSGVRLDDALALMQQIESETCAGQEISQWRRRLASGHGKFSELAFAGKAFPPMFIWLVSQSGNDLADGFKRAAEIYQNRATFRVDMLLYSALPCSVLTIGVLLVSQILPVFYTLTQLFRGIGEIGE